MQKNAKQWIEEYKRWTDNGFIHMLALKIKMNCWLPTSVEFRSKPGFNQYDIMINKEQSVLKK